MKYTGLQRRRQTIVVAFGAGVLLFVVMAIVYVQVQTVSSRVAPEALYKIERELNYTENSIINAAADPFALADELTELTGVSQQGRVVGYISKLQTDELMKYIDSHLAADNWVLSESSAGLIRFFVKDEQTILIQFMDYTIDGYNSVATVQALGAVK